MKRKRIRILAIAGLLMVAMVVATMPAEANTIVYAPIITGQETGFVLYPDDLAVIYYFPRQQGNRMFTAWHTNLVALDQAAGMDFYWKDTSNPNDYWHLWRHAAVGYWPKTSQNLYSGSNTIGYKFEFRQWTDYPLPIHIKIT